MARSRFEYRFHAIDEAWERFHIGHAGALLSASGISPIFGAGTGHGRDHEGFARL
jgi:hypothetical protein